MVRPHPGQGHLDVGAAIGRPQWWQVNPFSVTIPPPPLPLAHTATRSGQGVTSIISQGFAFANLVSLLFGVGEDVSAWRREPRGARCAGLVSSARWRELRECWGPPSEEGPDPRTPPRRELFPGFNWWDRDRGRRSRRESWWLLDSGMRHLLHSVARWPTMVIRRIIAQMFPSVKSL
jgi:hypothetical protein